MIYIRLVNYLHVDYVIRISSSIKCRQLNNKFKKLHDKLNKNTDLMLYPFLFALT